VATDHVIPPLQAFVIDRRLGFSYFGGSGSQKYWSLKPFGYIQTRTEPGAPRFFRSFLRVNTNQPTRRKLA
jgi:hypothetical protein